MTTGKLSSASREVDVRFEGQKFLVGDKVRKISGYWYPGVVVAAILTTKGESRYVVECTAPAVAGMLHIFSGEELAFDNSYPLSNNH
jgi:hypothetical protein